VRKEQPEAEDSFGKHIQNSVDDNFAVDVNGAGPVGETPDTVDVRCTTVHCYSVLTWDRMSTGVT
jgi:hypothetical protein